VEQSKIPQVLTIASFPGSLGVRRDGWRSESLFAHVFNYYEIPWLPDIQAPLFEHSIRLLTASRLGCEAMTFRPQQRASVRPGDINVLGMIHASISNSTVAN